MSSFLEVVRSLPRDGFHLTLAWSASHGKYMASFKGARAGGYKVEHDLDPAQAILKAMGSPLTAPAVERDADILG